MLPRRVPLEELRTAMPSFDVVSRTEVPEVDNAIQGAMREIGTRYDFKGSSCSIERRASNEAWASSHRSSITTGPVAPRTSDNVCRRPS